MPPGRGRRQAPCRVIAVSDHALRNQAWGDCLRPARPRRGSAPDCPNVCTWPAGFSFHRESSLRGMNTVVPRWLRTSFPAAGWWYFLPAMFTPPRRGERRVPRKRPLDRWASMPSPVWGASEARVLLASAWPSLPSLPAELCGGPSVRRAGEYRPQSACGRTGRPRSPSIQRDLAARCELVPLPV